MNTDILIIGGVLLLGIAFFWWVIREGNKEFGKGEKKKVYWGFKK